MLLKSMLGIFRARWPIVAITLASSLAGGAVVNFTSTPRYQASARVVLDYIKPNPITHEYVHNRMAEAYVTSQVRRVKDYQVAISAAQILGLLDDPDLQVAFSEAGGGSFEDFAGWLGGRIIASTNAELVGESNILEIRYTSLSPQMALQYAEALRTAYIQSSIEEQRAGASEGATSIGVRAEQIASRIAALEDAKAALQKRTGVVPNLDEERLSELAAAVEPQYLLAAGSPPASTPSMVQLAAAEANLARAAETMGPNNPVFRGLQVSRDLLKAKVQEERAQIASVADARDTAMRAMQAQVEAQKEKVLSNRQTELELKLLQDQIDLQTQTLNGLNQRIASLRQLSAIQYAAIFPMGPPEAKPHAVFPNPTLIFGGTGVLGLAIGALLALLVELLHRRARQPHDVEAAAGAPLLGVLPPLDNRAATGKRRKSVQQRVSRRQRRDTATSACS